MIGINAEISDCGSDMRERRKAMPCILDQYKLVKYARHCFSSLSLSLPNPSSKNAKECLHKTYEFCFFFYFIAAFHFRTSTSIPKIFNN